VVGAGHFAPAGATPAAIVAVNRQCDQLAATFLKEDWRNGFFDLTVVHAESAAKPDGARWWECVLSSYVEHNDVGNFPTREFRMLDFDLASGIPPALRHGCRYGEYDRGIIKYSYPVDCAAPHFAEYVGSVQLPADMPFPKSKGHWDVIHEACAPLLAGFVGANPPNVRHHYDVLMRDEIGWDTMKDIQCFVFTGPRTMVGSARGTRGVGVPW
jgi:hypothetical protein